MGLIAALFTSRLRAFKSDAFRQLPEDLQRKRLRRARRGGITLIIVGSLTAIGFAAVEKLTKDRIARTAQRRAAENARESQ
jgi:hypothetical protein